jgi:hypothetical protein
MITLEPIGHVRSSRSDLSDDIWGSVTARIVLDESLPEEEIAISRWYGVLWVTGSAFYSED